MSGCVLLILALRIGVRIILLALFAINWLLLSTVRADCTGYRDEDVLAVYCWLLCVGV